MGLKKASGINTISVPEIRTIQETLRTKHVQQCSRSHFHRAKQIQLSTDTLDTDS
eukprot:m.399386 g.399386  ORF g.399386 m.399386 type:complete len:55 (+) comp21147_c0_seq2:3768-3932(+)